MKIVLLASMSGEGGIQNFSRGFCVALRKEGAQVVAVDRSAFSKTSFMFRAAWAIVKERPQAVFCAHLYFSPLAYVLSFLRYPYVVFLHGIEAWDIKNSFHIRALRKATVICPVSAYTRDKVIQTTGLPSERFYLFPPFVDGERFSPGEPSAALRARWGLANKKVILTVARLATSEQYKGYDTVIRALPAVLKKDPTATYLIVGNGDDAARVKALVNELKLADAVVMAGRVSTAELPECYRLADVFAMPSSGEGFGMVFLEALACGKPAVAGNLDGAQDALLNGQLGLLVDPGSVPEVAAAITRCLDGDLPADLRDPAKLRAKILAAYGMPAFEARTRELLTRI